MTLKGISISRNDFFAVRQENPYSSPSNTEKLRTVGINEELIRPFLLGLSKATTSRNILNILLRGLFFVIITVFLGVCYFFLDGPYDYVTYCFAGLEIYIVLVYSLQIIASIVSHKRMLRRAQHIIDIENKRQNAYKFSISCCCLGLNIAPYSDTERGLVQISSDSLLKELYVVPDYLRDTTLSQFRLTFLRGSNFFDVACEDILKIQRAFKCAFLIFFIPMLIAYVGGLIYFVYSYNGFDIIICTIVIGWCVIIFLGIIIIRLFMIKALKEILAARNEEFKSQGVYFDLNMNILYIYVFQPFDVVVSYKTDHRTSKYF
jgi:hypothetical protein